MNNDPSAAQFIGTMLASLLIGLFTWLAASRNIKKAVAQSETRTVEKATEQIRTSVIGPSIKENNVAVQSLVDEALNQTRRMFSSSVENIQQANQIMSDTFRQALEYKDHRIGALQAQLTDFQTLVHDLENRNNNLEKEISEFRLQWRQGAASRDDKIEAQTVQIAALEAQSKQVAERMNSAEAELIKAQQEIDDLNRALEVSKRDLANAETRLRAMELALKTVTEDRDRLRSDLEAKTREVEALRKQVDGHEKTIDHLQSRVQELQAELDTQRASSKSSDAGGLDMTKSE